MKLVRYGAPGTESPGLVDAHGTIRSLEGHVDDIAGAGLDPAALDRLRAIAPDSLPAVASGVRLGPCVGRVGKCVAIGLNYADHAAEAGMEVPAEPIVFMKATSALSGPNDDVAIPPGSTRTDWEVELGFAIGREARRIDETDAMDHVAGYFAFNDVSERTHQLEGTGQWVKGKSADTFGPMGPWLVTRDEVPDPQDLELWLELDGERLQDGSTRTMVFGVAFLVSYLSRFMTLEPGDIVITGTPPGVGMGLSAPRYLRAGNVMRLGIDGLGVQTQKAVDSKRAASARAEAVR